MKKYIFKLILRLLLIIIPLCVPKIIERITILLYYDSDMLFCEPGDNLVWITLCCALLCCCIGGVILHDYIRHERTRKYIKLLVIVYCIVFGIPFLFIKNRTVITEQNAVCYDLIGNVQNDHELLKADDISIAFHNRTYRNQFSDYTITYSFSYDNSSEFSVEIETYNEEQLNKLLTLHEKILGDKTNVNINLGSFQNNSDAEKFKELFALPKQRKPRENSGVLCGDYLSMCELTYCGTVLR